MELIVKRPATEARELAEHAILDPATGLSGDNWFSRGSSRTPDRSANRDAQLTLMNSRAIALIAATKERWPLAGDQLYVDFDISAGNLPAGSRLKIGDAMIEITAEPHLGCGKFKARFGEAALTFVNSPIGRELRLRGLNARIITGGPIRVGDRVEKA